VERHRGDRTPEAKGQYERQLDGDAKVRLVALVCRVASEGREPWTVQLLADKL